MLLSHGSNMRCKNKLTLILIIVKIMAVIKIIIEYYDDEDDECIKGVINNDD